MYLQLDEIDTEPLAIDGGLELSQIRDEAGRRLVPGKARLSGDVRRGPRGVELRGRWEATVRLECSRCLEPYEDELGDEFFLILVGDAVEFGVGEAEIRPEDAALFYVRGGRADLAELMGEQVLLALPLKPVCGPGCDGLCPTCGANRNRIKCECVREEVDPRLAPLADLKRRIGETES